MRLGETNPIPDGLALEYKRDYGTACGELDVADLVNNPAANGKCRILGLRFSEEALHLVGAELRAFLENPPDPSMVRVDRIQPFP